MNAPSVLITGGAGFIGSHVAERFGRAGFDVRVLDDLSTGSLANLAPDWQLHRDSVTDPESTDRAVAGCEVVVHLAAFTSVPDSFERHRECFRSNVHGSFNVLKACAAHAVRRLVFASSSAVYGERPADPKHEDETPDPISPYAVSKLEGEHLLELFSEQHDLSSAALRFFNVFGPRQPADSDYAAAVPIFFEHSLRGDPVTIYGDGHQTRDFVYVGDVADAVFESARSELRGIFNVGSGRATEVLELAETIQKLCGAEPLRRFETLRPGDLRCSTANVEKLAAALGWRTSTSLADGLAETLDWTRESALPSSPA